MAEQSPEHESKGRQTQKDRHFLIIDRDMDDVVQRFTQHLRLELNLSGHTVTAYGHDLEQFSGFLTSGGKRQLDLRSVTQSDVRAWLVSLSRTGDSSRTLRRKVQAVRALYKWLMWRGEADCNPAADVELAKLPKQLPHTVRLQSINALLDSPVDMADHDEVRNRLIVMMLYETGMRRAELIGLKDAWVDTDKGELKVHGKRDKDRIIPFGHELAQWIESYRHLRTETYGHCEAFFVRREGKPLYPSLVYNVVHTALASVGGGSKLSPHVLRHTFASAMLNDGAEINSVKELLGHESLAATQIYTHVTFNELQTNYKLAHPRALKKGG